MKELEQAILELICRIYNKKYIGYLKVDETFDDTNSHLGYLLKLGLNKDEKPLTIAGEGDTSQFLKFIEKELRLRYLDEIDYFSAIQL